MNLLVNGASISRGPDSWPYYLQNLLGCNLVNLSMAGCGNTYIHETTIGEIGRRHYDLVLIMWAECGRMDFRVDDIAKFSDSKNTSLYQSQQNDWPTKIVEPINDQDYVEKNWIFSLGTMRGERNDSVSKIFLPCHTVTSYRQVLESEYIRMISLQSVLKTQNIPYLFMHWRPIKTFKRFDHLMGMVDWSRVLEDPNLETISKQNSWLADDGIHPDAQAHEYFAQHLYTKITDGTLGNLVGMDNPATTNV
jgi:hypothetical protein